MKLILSFIQSSRKHFSIIFNILSYHSFPFRLIIRVLLNIKNFKSTVIV